MTTYGLTSAGYLARRTADIVDSIRARIENATGETFDWAADTFWAVVTLAVAEELGSAEEAIQAVYDSWDRNNATDLQLDVLGALIGVPRNDASYSEATVTLTGASGTPVPSGALVEGGGPDDTSRWVLTESVSIGTMGTVDATVHAVDPGAVGAAVGKIDAIVTPVSGWTSVTNAAAVEDGAGIGNDRESDDDYRRRQASSMQIIGSGSTNAIRAALLDLDYLSNVVVVENDTFDAAVVSGLSLDPVSIFVVLYPQTTVDEQLQEIADTIHGRLPAGTKTMGTDETASVVKADGQIKTIAWDWSSELTVNVVVTVELEAGYTVLQVTPPIGEVVTRAFSALQVGEPMYDLDVLKLLDDVDGLKRATVTLNAATSVTPSASQLCVKGTVTVTL